MKKISTLLFALLAMVTLQSVAATNVYLVGGISSKGWVTTDGDAFSTTDGENYTLETNVYSGDQYFCLATGFADTWDDFAKYRLGADGQVVTLGVPTVLKNSSEGDVGSSPKITIAETGTYVFSFVLSTRTLTVTKKGGSEPTGPVTIYITKESTGNIWAWDASGNYFDAWPGVAFSTLSETIVNEIPLYTFTYTHNTTGNGIVFNDGTNQTADITAVNNAVYIYKGGSTYEISQLPEPTAVSDVNVSKAASVRKVMENGRIVIYNGNAKFDIMGARIK